MTDIKQWDYVWTTALGMVPSSFPIVSGAALAGTMLIEKKPVGPFQLVLSVASMAAGVYVVIRLGSLAVEVFQRQGIMDGGGDDAAGAAGGGADRNGCGRGDAAAGGAAKNGSAKGGHAANGATNGGAANGSAANGSAANGAGAHNRAPNGAAAAGHGATAGAADSAFADLQERLSVLSQSVSEGRTVLLDRGRRALRGIVPYEQRASAPADML
jgi:hypothetical protein